MHKELTSPIVRTSSASVNICFLINRFPLVWSIRPVIIALPNKGSDLTSYRVG